MDASKPGLQREAVRESVKRARKVIDSAPTHVKVMAGAYILPLLDAVEALSAELEILRSMGGANGNHP